METYPRQTIRLSKTLNPSSKYSKTPKATSLRTISIEKMQLKITLLISRTCKSKSSFSKMYAKLYPCECYWLIMMLQRQAKGIEENTNSYSLQEDAVKNHSSHIFSDSCKSPLSFSSSIKYEPII